jgi:Domain of unknown function (DUF5122) beta-propeller
MTLRTPRGSGTWTRRTMLVTTGSVAALLTSMAGAQAATTVADTVESTYQTNGRVAAVVTVGSTVYVGGDFTSVRPYGASSGGTSRNRLAAFDRDTGALLTWNPGANKSVYGLAASPDGKTIYVAGNFGTVGGKSRKHIAAVDAGNGRVTDFTVTTDRKVYAVAATGTRVYFGGNFTSVNGQAHARLAAVTTDGALDPSWSPSADDTVRALTLAPDQASVYVGGEFSAVNGSTTQKRLAKLSLAGAVAQKWTSHPTYPIWSIVADGANVYVGGNGSGGHAGQYTSTGSKGWVIQTDGGAQAVTLRNGILYVGGHFDNVCLQDTAGPTTGFTCKDNAATRHKLLAVDAASGAVDPWNPGADSPLGVFALATSAGKVLVGGDFTRIGHFRSQQGYAQFS